MRFKFENNQTLYKCLTVKSSISVDIYVWVELGWIYKDYG